MAKKQQNNFYDDEYSESIFIDVNSGKEVNVFLVNGIKLTGEILSHDDRSLLLANSNSKNMIYKNAISTISLTR